MKMVKFVKCGEKKCSPDTEILQYWGFVEQIKIFTQFIIQLW